MFGNACQALLDRVASRLGRRRHRKAMVGMPAMKLTNERRDGHHFAKRHRMHPDERPVIWADAGNLEAEPPGQSPTAARLGEEQRKHHR